MSKLFRLIAMMLTLIIVCSFFCFKVPIREARATYVEGPIDKDTVWTLVDSPFVVSNDITVYPGVTLTIEPAVEVRFGGNFSLIVDGTLVAEGTETKNIKFTSNSLNPQPGDWGTIQLRTPDSSASLSNCVAEYGTNGITLENGSLTLKDSLVRFNSNSGIAATGGNAQIDNNNIENNTASGINIEENNGVSVYYNNLTLNFDGIKLAGNFTSENPIQQNYFFNNSNSGLFLGAQVEDKNLIVKNVFSYNNNGFYAATNKSSITQNYFLNNTVGMYYESGSEHDAHFNDIYGNNMGMDVSASANVSAEYNYWGDRTGPNHRMLNPKGRGNPVGGDGTNLRFIFFLTDHIDHANVLPTADLWADKLLVAPNQNVTLVGTGSQDEGRVDEYNFDFDDNSSSGWTTLSLFNHKYSSIGTYNTSLTVKDDFNQTSTNNPTVTINVQDLPSLAVALALSNTTVNNNENVSTSVYVSDAAGPVKNANVELHAVRGGNLFAGSFSLMQGQTDDSGYYNTTFTAPDVFDITNVRIIARASRGGYADGSDFEYVKVLPPLTAQVTAEPQSMMSEENATITIGVVDAYGQPSADALLTLETDGGSLLLNSNVTDSSGNASFLFIAPQTFTQSSVTITFRAQKTGYADGYGQTTITIEPKKLNLIVSVKPIWIVSENTTVITASVASNSNPTPEANVTISSDAAGTFSNTTETTDENGVAQFIYTAPRLTMPQALRVTFNVTASKPGYVNDQTRAMLIVIPKTLIVRVDAQPNATTSESNVSISVHVAYSYDMSPLKDANVTVTSDNGGTFPVTDAQTDTNGNATFIFEAPPTSTAINISISAFVEKTGYVSQRNQTTINVQQGTLTIRTQINTQPLTPGETAIITAFATCNGNPVANTSVTVSSNFGYLDVQSGTTDTNGMCRFVYTAPNTTIALVATITSNANKNGYTNAQDRLRLDVIPNAPQQSGIPIITLLMILIPVLAVVIVVILIKKKVVLISFGEEEE